MLTKEEIAVIMYLIDAGIRTMGAQIFQQVNNGELIQSSINKFQAMADAEVDENTEIQST